MGDTGIGGSSDSVGGRDAGKAKEQKRSGQKSEEEADERDTSGGPTPPLKRLVG